MIRKHFPFCFYVLVSVLCLGKPLLAYPSENLNEGGAIPSLDAISETDSITPLKIGDKIPDELWDYAFPVVSPHADQVQYLTLGDYRDKLIILDFWATWCGTCLKFLPGLDSLQNSLSDIVQILPVSTDSEERIRSYFERAGITLPSVIEDELLKVYFPHNYVPYQVWIKEGKVLAFTEPIHVTDDNIRKVAAGTFELPQRYDNVDFDLYRPLLAGNGGGPENIRYRSTITGFLEGVHGSGRILQDTAANINKVILPNMTIKGLYTYIIQYENPALRRKNRIIYETDKRRIITTAKSPNWYPELRQYYYSYELLFPSDDRKELSQMLRSDLNRYFKKALGLEGRVERRTVKCWVLEQKSTWKQPMPTSEQYRKERKGDRVIYKNFLLKAFFNELNGANRDSEMPFVNLTEEGIKMDLNMPSDLNDLTEVRRSLNEHGLELTQREEPIEVLVFMDVEN